MKNSQSIRYLFGIYGFILPTFYISDSAIDTFNRNNLTAFTAAANPVLSVRPSLPTSSFQVGQSRLGFDFPIETLGKGVLEFDFIDFTKSSPTTAALPRVRRASIDLALGDGYSLLAGQDWDLFNSGVHPYTYNFVGHFFSAGDSGFMRTQFTLKKKIESFQIAVSFGLPAANNTSIDSTTELSLLPVTELQAQWSTDSIRFGVTLLGALTLTDVNSSDRIMSAGAVAYEESSSKDSPLSTKAKVYCGKNLSNLGMLSLSYGRIGNDVSECGAVFTPKYQLSSSTGVFLGMGFAAAIQPEMVAAAYSGSPGSYTLNTQLPGIERNLTARIGFDHELAPKVKVFSELSFLSTRHKLRTAELSSGINTEDQAFILGTGLMLTL
ncbi:MAG: hypothetical protein KA715_03180 [Xanthomonadaceae bacterium]|nr:hypothetical protein [Xanthomonadaceae bacterium]